MVTVPRPVISVTGVHLGRNARKRPRRGHAWTTADRAFGRVAEECRAGSSPPTGPAKLGRLALPAGVWLVGDGARRAVQSPFGTGRVAVGASWAESTVQVGAVGGPDGHDTLPCCPPAVSSHGLRRSRCGHPAPGRSGWWATSTAGTAACTRCARWAAPVSGRSSCPGVGPGAHYKFEVFSQQGQLSLRADPFAFATEIPPSTASVVTRSEYEWQDAAWFAERAATDLLHAPVSIYECHLGSWRLTQDGDGWRPLTYRETADILPGYLTDLGFTHVEFLPVAEHPFAGGVWGYQVTGYYAPTARFGTPDDFRYLVDRLHQAGDWASSSTGWSGTSPRTTGRWPALTARHCMSTPTRAWASIRTGAPWSSTTGDTRCGTSCWPTRCSGSRSSTSMACASTRLPPCSTWTTRAGRASGSPTASAAGRTWKPSTSSRKSTRSYTATTRPPCWWRRSPPPGRPSPAPLTWVVSASASNGTWGG